MGTGITIVGSYKANYNINLIDVSRDNLERSKKFINKYLDKEVNKKRLLDKDTVLNKITYSTDLSLISNSSILIEAVNENFDMKSKIFQFADKIMPSNSILATNTSSISITKISMATKEERRPNIIGMHFMNPVPIMPLIEIIPSKYSSDSTIDAIKKYCSEFQKT